MRTTPWRRTLVVTAITVGTLIGFRPPDSSALMPSEQGLRDAAASRVLTVEAYYPPPPKPAQPPKQKKPINERIVAVAAAQAGKPYAYGAEGPDAFDCSGLAQYVHRQVGIHLPRTSQDQRNATPHIARSDRLPGDLIFFHGGGGVYHVGIYAGNNLIWDAPETGDHVRKRKVWSDSYTVGRAW